MKYSYNWLKELSGTKKTAQQVAEDLTMRSMEVEGVEMIGQNLERVVVGEILEIKKHPNADKLQIVKVNIGPQLSQPLPSSPLNTGAGVLKIVCGAHNIQTGDKVPVALVGAVLPASSAGESCGLKIKEAEIRGEKSFGMLCAKDELGLGTDHSGIFILDKNAKIGMPLAKYLKQEDSIIEIKVLPDRAHDALSHVGVAREIAVLENRKFDYDFEGLKLPKIKFKKSGIGRGLFVRIEDAKLCPRYIGAVMENVKIQESPEWMKARLAACGIKSINNVVDATNFVMLELGNPLHAFDAEKISISGKDLKIIVRRAKNKEKLILLDESEIELTENDLLITSGETPLALAGIMGGLNSGISAETKTVVLEAANFNAAGIRKTRTRLSIKTESSDRFEKDIDPNLAEKAMTRLIEILEKISSGKVEGIADIYPKKIMPVKIKLNLNYANNLLGELIPSREVIKILNLLGIYTKYKPHPRLLLSKEREIVECEIPTFRVDLKTQEDLIEEIGRVRGYEKIKIAPLMEEIVPSGGNENVFFARKIKNNLAMFGFDEMYNYSFYSEKDAQNCALDAREHLELANPMSPEQKYVRASLLPNILKNIKENMKHFSEFGIFEIGRTYLPEKNEIQEKRMLVMAQVLTEDKSADAFFSLKGALENLLESLGIKSTDSRFGVSGPNRENFGFAHPSRSSEIRINSDVVGDIFEINPSVLAKYKITKRAAVAEIDLLKLLAASPKEKTYQPIGKFPTVTRDISLLAPKNITVAEILNGIKKFGGELVQSAELFDIFQKDDENSFAFHIVFASPERTLENQEIEKLMEKIILSLEKNLKIEIRK